MLKLCKDVIREEAIAVAVKLYTNQHLNIIKNIMFMPLANILVK